MKKSQIRVIPFISHKRNCFQSIIQHWDVDWSAEGIAKTANISVNISFCGMVVNKLSNH